MPDITQPIAAASFVEPPAKPIPRQEQMFPALTEAEIARIRRFGTLPVMAALTLHVYGGEMNHCTIFEPAGADLYRPLARILSYDE